jgi:hypothetical protein
MGIGLTKIGDGSQRDGNRSEMRLRISTIAITRALLCAVALVGCTVFICRPITLTVANKRELARFETVPGAMRTTETGRLEEDVRQSTTVREYWVQTREGTWYRVSAEQFRAAEIGRELQVCE